MNIMPFMPKRIVSASDKYVDPVLPPGNCGHFRKKFAA